MPPAWAVDQSVLEAAERDGLTHAVFEERLTGRVWCAPLGSFRVHGFRFDRGHGEQVALPLHRWACRFDIVALLDAADRTAQQTRPAPPLHRVAQGELFGMPA